jgi:branched-chain amino acid transport system substrate-binding protein
MTRISRRSLGHAVALVFVLSVIAGSLSACGGGGSSQGETSSGSAAGSTTSGGTSDAAAAGVPQSAVPGEKASGTPLKVGFIFDEGGTAISQPEGREAAEAVVAYANEQLGGLKGRPIELMTCSTKVEVAAATNCANQMVQEEVVGVVVSSTAEGEAIVPIITKAGIPYAFPTGTSPVEYTLPGAFNLTSGLPGPFSASAKYAKENGIKNVTMFVLDAGGFAATAESLAKPAYEEAGVNIAFSKVPEGTPDATPEVTAGLRSNPDAVFIEADATGCIAVMKGLESLGSSVLRWLPDTCLTPSVVETVSAENFEGATNFTVDDVSTNDPEARTYRWVMSKFAPEAPTTGVAPVGYQAMLSFIRVADNAKGAVTAKSVLASFTSGKEVKLAVGHGLTFNCGQKIDPTLPAICGEGVLAATLDGEAKLGTVKVIK